MDELENLPTLLECIKAQSHSDFTLYCCVNQPESWWNGNEEERRICTSNQHTIKLLENERDLDVRILDMSSPGKGMTGKKHGVGWARKKLLEAILSEQSEDDVIVSLDGDTTFGPRYLESILRKLNLESQVHAISMPYYHPLTEDENQNRAILRYETYMRYYEINLLRIRSPYAFSALGSAMVFPLWAYKRVGGFSPLQGGEDFYLMQKFAKTGIISLTCEAEHVEPQSRISHRVPFGTGPAVAKGLEEMNLSYPFFGIEAFEEISATCKLFPALYEQDMETPLTKFLSQQLATTNLWGPLRKNFKSQEHFVRACHERLDGLRILQFLRSKPLGGIPDLRIIAREAGMELPQNFDFATSPLSLINSLRNSLMNYEMELRRKKDSQIGLMTK